MKILDIQHELLYDHDNIVISLPKSERARIIEYLQGLNVQKEKEYDIKITRHSHCHYHEIQLHAI